MSDKIIKVDKELHKMLKVGASENDISIKAFIRYLFKFEEDTADELEGYLKYLQSSGSRPELYPGIKYAIESIRDGKEHDIDMAKLHYMKI